MRSTLAALLLPVALWSCSSDTSGLSPTIVAPIAQQQRCYGISSDLAFIDVVDDPVPFREVPPGFLPDEWWIGVDVTVTVGRVLAATSRAATFRTPPAGTLRVHLYTDIDRTVRTGNFDARDTSMIVRGRRLLVQFPLFQSTRVDWPFLVIRTDPAVQVLAEGWYQFPGGTATNTVLDPVEWNNPARGCTPYPGSSPNRPLGDGGG